LAEVETPKVYENTNEQLRENKDGGFREKYSISYFISHIQTKTKHQKKKWHYKLANCIQFFII